MRIQIQFFSYFRDMTGLPSCVEELPSGADVALLLRRLADRFPALAQAERCTLVAVGVDYCSRDRVLADGEEVSLFPPVQGG